MIENADGSVIREFVPFWVKMVKTVVMVKMASY